MLLHFYQTTQPLITNQWVDQWIKMIKWKCIQRKAITGDTSNEYKFIHIKQTLCLPQPGLYIHCICYSDDKNRREILLSSVVYLNISLSHISPRSFKTSKISILSQNDIYNIEKQKKLISYISVKTLDFCKLPSGLILAFCGCVRMHVYSIMDNCSGLFYSV